MLRLGKEFERKQGYLPCIVFENVARLLSGPAEDPGQWFGEFLHSLAEVGYDAEWFCVTAAGVGAHHKRERVCVVAYPNRKHGECGQGERPRLWVEEEEEGSDYNLGGSVEGQKVTSYPNASLGERGSISSRVYQKYADIDGDAGAWREWGGGEPEICGMDDGIQKRSHRLALMGNAIVPQCFAPVMEAVRECLNN